MKNAILHMECKYVILQTGQEFKSQYIKILLMKQLHMLQTQII